MRIRSSRVSAHRTPAWLQATLALTSVLAATNCSAPPGAIPVDDDDSDIPEYSGSFGAPGTSTPVQPGANTPSNGATGSTNTNGSAPAPTNNGSEQNGASNAPLNPSTNTNTGSNSGASNNGSTPANNGAAGSSMVPPPSGNQGAGGSSMGGTGNTPAEPPPNQNPPVTQPPVTQPPAAGPDIPCPVEAFFCSGFENGFPEGTNNILGGSSFDNAFALDTAEKHSGAQSFLVPPTMERFSYRVLAIPVTTQQFWVRMFFRTDVAFGSSNDHESIFAVSTGNLTEDNNAESRGRRVELSEQFGYMLLNVSDTTPEPLVRTQLSANEWHCVEARYDGAAGQVEIFADGEQFIDQEGALVQLNIQTFRLGYMKFNGGQRSVWYDDVILSSNRIGCN